MNSSSLLSIIALGIGACLFATAAFLVLLRRTRGLPPRRRTRSMAEIARSELVKRLPSRRSVSNFALGFIAFTGTLVIGLVITGLTVWAIHLQLPHPEEAYEGIGYGITILVLLSLGASLSLCAAIAVGCVVADRSSRKPNAPGELPSGSAPHAPLRDQSIAPSRG